MDRFDRMRVEMAAGQLLDLAAGEPGRSSPRVASLKTGSYTAEGPVLIGCALAGASGAVEAPLRVYAGLVGQAFQLRDDVVDGDAAPGEAARVDELVRRAEAAVKGVGLDPEGRDRLIELAALLRFGGAA
jgi:geranylgeranyl pyrophosphate synthase